MRYIYKSTFLIFIISNLFSQTDKKSLVPGSNRSDGEGPYKRMVIRGATLINGTGSPPIGPVDIVIQDNRITDVRSVGYPGVPINENRRPKKGDYEINARGQYVMPGFVDLHAHAGSAQKLSLIHI